MRGEVSRQSAMFAYFSLEQRVPADHPLRRIKGNADEALRAISSELEALYSSTGRLSVPPERLLKRQLLIALYSVRSDRAFCDQLDYNLLFRWFLDMSLDEPGLDQSTFSRLRERLVKADVARKFFEQVIRLARAERLLSAEHFTVDSTLIESWASLKSRRRRRSRRDPAGTAAGWSTSRVALSASRERSSTPTLRHRVHLWDGASNACHNVAPITR